MHGLRACCFKKLPPPTTFRQKRRSSSGRQRRKSPTHTACPPPTAAISLISKHRLSCPKPLLENSAAVYLVKIMHNGPAAKSFLLRRQATIEITSAVLVRYAEVKIAAAVINLCDRRIKSALSRALFLLYLNPTIPQISKRAHSRRAYQYRKHES